jgi:exopolysaccharide biosynthesis WecB/TagA/CpsF family protein
VTGSDLTVRLLRDPRMEEGRIAVVGGDSELLAAVAQQIPRATLLHHVPPMGVRRNVAAQEVIAEFVESSQSGLTLFAIGAPQSEVICNLILRRGQANGVALCIGASLEFMIGAKQRAPTWMQRMGAEWLFRLLSEPRRLWRRYLVEGPRIFRLWWCWHNARPHARKAGR